MKGVEGGRKKVGREGDRRWVSVGGGHICVKGGACERCGEREKEGGVSGRATVYVSVCVSLQIRITEQPN